LTLVLLPVVGFAACSGGDERPPVDGVGPGGNSGGAGLGGDQGSGGAAPVGGAAGAAGAGAGGTAPGVTCAEQVCSEFASCFSVEEAPACVCGEGLRGDGLRCDDVDECQEEPALCGPNAACENSLGSYHCACFAGYEWVGDGCQEIDECSSGPCADGAECADLVAGYECTCPEEQFGDGTFCKVVDDCADDPCGPGGSCINTPSGHACLCDLGYQGSQSCVACGESLEVTDPGLQVAVNLQLGRAFDDDSAIPLSLLSGETRLDAADFYVAELAGLECWTELEVLDLSYNTSLTSSDLAPV